jgi:hypothetical protein
MMPVSLALAAGTFQSLTGALPHRFLGAERPLRLRHLAGLLAGLGLVAGLGALGR